jgi:octaprenyl-diphosphate synthase
MSHIHTHPLLACIENDLKLVEETLQNATQSEIGAVRIVSGHTLLSGGKRLRPAVAVLAARSINRVFPNERSYAAAAACEMIHMATLMHDDVVDEAPERRGSPTAGSVYGNGIAVLTGDFLFARALELMVAYEENLNIIRVFTRVTVGMAEGEVLQATVAHKYDLDVPTYEKVLDLKTARFIAGCCEMGGVLAGGTPEEGESLRLYGQNLGMAFQIADDLLDFLGDPKHTGKPLGTDLRDGRVTLPLIYALKVADAETKTALITTLAKKELTDGDIASVTATLARLGGFEYARGVAEDYAEKAALSIVPLPESPYKEAMTRLARYVVARDR